MSKGVSDCPTSPPIVPLIPEIDLIKVIVFHLHLSKTKLINNLNSTIFAGTKKMLI